MGNEYHRRGFFWPLLLIALGVLLFLNQMGIVVGNIWSYWPVLLIVAGLDSIFSQRRFVGPLVLIGMGSIFLLGNLGMLNVSVWTLVLKLWPVILVAAGFDILLGSRSFWSTFGGLLLGLALIAGILWYSVFQPGMREVPQSESVQVGLQDATSAKVWVETIQGRTIIRGVTEPSNLVEGDVQGFAGETLNKDYTVSEKNGNLVLKTQGNYSSPDFLMASGTSPEINLKLNPSVPLDLTLKQVIGDQQADLSGLNLKSLSIENVIGRTTVTLSKGNFYKSNLKVVIGELVVYVPRNIPIQIHLGTAVTAVNYPPEFRKEGNDLYLQGGEDAGSGVSLNVEQPIGSLVVQYAP